MNLGKSFEEKFKQDWIKTFPDSFIMRLYDQVSGYIVSRKLTWAESRDIEITHYFSSSHYPIGCSYKHYFEYINWQQYNI